MNIKIKLTKGFEMRLEPLSSSFVAVVGVV